MEARRRVRLIKIIKAAFAVLLSGLIYCYVCCILLPKDSKDVGGKNYFMGRGFLGEPKKNSLDVIVFGNSNVYSGFSPGKLFEEYGYTSYASGVARQTVGQIDNLLDAALKSQKPKIAVLDVDCLYTPEKMAMDSSNFFLAPFTFHYRWKHLKGYDFYKFPQRNKTYDINKGYFFHNEKESLSPGDYMGERGQAPKRIPKKTLKKVRRFVRVCKENGVVPIFIELPTTVGWTYARHNYVEEFAGSESVPFYDFNIQESGYTPDFENDFRDDMHMNVYGAERVTLFLGGILEKHCDSLFDKREDPAYGYWREAVEFYERKKTDF